MEHPIDRAGAEDVPFTPVPPAPQPVPPVQRVQPQPAPGEGPLPLPPGTETAEKPHIPQPCLFVSFVGRNKKDKQVHGRANLVGVLPFVDIQQLAAAENLVGENRGLTAVEILNWKLLRT